MGVIEKSKYLIKCVRLTISTTKLGRTIDADFTRFITHLRTDIYITYFSHHRPLITVLNDRDKDNEDDNAIIEQ